MKAIGIVVVLVATRAYAGHGGGGGGSCSHGGGGSSSSGGGYRGGGGGDSSSSSSSSSSESTACEESTDVEGYRECVQFGLWADNMTIPRIVIEVGSNVRQFTSMAPGADGSVTHGDETFAYRVAMPASAQRAETAVTMTARMLVGTDHLYAGLEGEIGGLAAPASVTAEMLSTGTYGSPVLDETGATFLGGYGVAGVRAGTSRFAVAAEMAGGVRDVEYRFDSSYHDCEQTSSIDAVRGVVEARARAEVWVYPWVSIGATVGTSVLDRGDWLGGMYVGLHSRAYGGLR